MSLSLFLQIAVTMAFSGFFSGMEIAFVSSNKLRLEMEKENNDNITNRILSIFYRNSNDFISTLLVGNNIALVVYGILMAQLIKGFLFNFFGDGLLLVLVETILSTLIILVTGEFLPKTLFKINPNATLEWFAIPAFLCYIILYPISKVSSHFSFLILKMFGAKIKKDNKNKSFTKVDLDYFIQSSIDNTHEKENIDDEVKIFQNALDFSSIKVRDCMIPRTEIVAVATNCPLEELKSVFIESGNSKILVYKDNIDKIIGYIHSSEMFKDAENWMDHIRQMPIVPETMQAQKLMKIFMQQKKSLAVVVDEFGGTSGIVSLEDLVEEIFGEIEDEHDNTSYIAKEIGEDEYILSARLEIENVNKQFGLNLPESDEYVTIGGLILNEYQSFPKLHEVIKLGNYEFKIIKISTTKIELIKLKVLE